jgi:hypothetical protein
MAFANLLLVELLPASPNICQPSASRGAYCEVTVWPDMFTYMGMEAVARTKWEDKYAPEGWDEEVFKALNNGEPDVVCFVYNPDRENPYNPR